LGHRKEDRYVPSVDSKYIHSGITIGRMTGKEARKGKKKGIAATHIHTSIKKSHASMQ
jgi:hypothetical protein